LSQAAWDLFRGLTRKTYVDRRGFVAAAGSAALTLALEPRALAARLGGAPLAYVTADLESHVVVLDISRAEVVGRIRVGPGPRSIEAVRSTIAVVAHTGHGVVSLLDVVPGRVRAEIEGFEAPRYAAVHPGMPYAYVTDSEREEVVVLDVERARILGRVRVPGPARHVSVSPHGQTLWTVLGTAASRIAVLDASDPRRPRLVRTFSPPFPAHDVVFAHTGGAVWVTSGSEGRIAIYRRGRPARVLDAGAAPQHVAFGRTKAFVTSGDDGTVRRHRLDGSLVREVRVPVGSYNVTFDWSGLVSPSLADGAVSVLDRNGRVRVVQRVARATHDACIVFGP
jgi:DNA-binding beta-propeller fold protein YncE